MDDDQISEDRRRFLKQATPPLVAAAVPALVMRRGSYMQVSARIGELYNCLCVSGFKPYSRLRS